MSRPYDGPERRACLRALASQQDIEAHAAMSMLVRAVGLCVAGFVALIWSAT